MGVRKMRQIGQISGGVLGLMLTGSPALAQTPAGGGLNIVDLFQSMGPTAIAVAIVLFIMSFWSVGVAIERIYTYNKARQQSKAFAPQVAKHLKDQRLKEAIALSSSKDYRYSHLAKVVLAGLQEYQFQQETSTALGREDLLDTVRRSIQRASALTASDLKKGVNPLATIGSTAPFVGLLGTVVGVINAFVGIASTGSGGIGAVSAGIAEALVETALGLFVAIPAVWFYNYLQSRLEYFNVEMDNSSSQLVDYFIGRTSKWTHRSGTGASTMAMQLGSSTGVKSDINVTPLVDVMLVLLIIMMIVAPLLQQGVPVKLPVATNSSEKPETQDQTVLAITPDKRLWINAVQVPEGDLRRRVQEVLDTKREKIIIIKADEDVEYGAVMAAMDELRASGIEDMGLITEGRRTLLSKAAGAQ